MEAIRVTRAVQADRQSRRSNGFWKVSMSSPQLRRVDRAMPEQRVHAMLERSFSGRLATVGEDGYPYCMPLLYVWMDGEIYVHTGSGMQ